MKSIGYLLWVQIALIMVHCFYTWIGFNYVEAELARTGDENVLNNMKDGVIIIYETKGDTPFQNKAVQDIEQVLKMKCEKSLWMDDTNARLDMETANFSIIDNP